MTALYKHLNVHLISDSTGSTVDKVAKSSLSQFDSLVPKYFDHYLIRTDEKLKNTLRIIENNPGIVFSTLAQKNQVQVLKSFCETKKIPVLNLLDEPVKLISQYTGIDFFNWGRENAEFGVQYKLDDLYEKRIHSMQFSIAQDDGQNPDNLKNSDIIILGASRTSKTPLTIYLANKGYKVSNVPLINGIHIPYQLESILTDRKNILVVGLTINSLRLQEIRKNRLEDLKRNSSELVQNYIDLETIEEELKQIKYFFNRNRIPIIDVSKRSIEEVATRIIDIYNRIETNSK